MAWLAAETSGHERSSELSAQENTPSALPGNEATVPSAGNCFVLANVSKSYRSAAGKTVRPLCNLAMTVPWDCSVAVVGHSGIGKSTLMHLLGLLDAPDAGEIVFDDGESSSIKYGGGSQGPAVLTEDLLRRKFFGFVFQQGHLVRHLNSAENVALPLVLNGQEPEERSRVAQELLKIVGLPDHGTRNVRELSGGEAQRVAILRAIAHSPRVVFADEPTGNLDPAASEVVFSVLKSWLRDKSRPHPRTLILVTHNLELAHKYCDYFAILKDGVLLDEELKQKTKGFTIDDLRRLAGVEMGPERELPMAACPGASKPLRALDFFYLGYKDLFGRGNAVLTWLTMLALCLVVSCVTVGWGFFYGQKTKLLEVLDSLDARAFEITCLETAEPTVHANHVKAFKALKTPSGTAVFPDDAGGIYLWNRARHLFWRGSAEEELQQAGATASGRTVQQDDPWLGTIRTVSGQPPVFSGNEAEEIVATKVLLEKFCGLAPDADTVFLSYKSGAIPLTVVAVAESPAALNGNLFLLPDGLQQRLVNGTYDPERQVDVFWLTPVGVDSKAAFEEIENGFSGTGVELSTDGDRIQCKLPTHKPWAWTRSWAGEIVRGVKERMQLKGGFSISPPESTSRGGEPSNSHATGYLRSVFDVGAAAAGVKANGLRPVSDEYLREVERYDQIIRPLNLVLSVGLVFVTVFISGTLAALLSQRIMQREAEIGILKANGMKPATILGLYATESGFMGLVIGSLGVLFGWLGGLWLCSFIEGVSLAEASLFTLGYLFSLGIPISIFAVSVIAAAFVSHKMANMHAADAVR